MKELKKWKTGYLILSAAVMILGLCLVIRPGISAEVLCWLVGAVLTIAGAVRIVCYFSRGISVLWHRYELPLGLLDVLLGVYFFSHPANVMLLLPTVVGVVVIVDSVFKLQTALELRGMGVRRWRSVFALSIVCILAGIFLIRNPFQGTVTLMVCLGVSLIIDSVQSMLFITSAAKAVRRNAPVEAEFTEVE